VALRGKIHFRACFNEYPGAGAASENDGSLRSLLIFFTCHERREAMKALAVRLAWLTLGVAGILNSQSNMPQELRDAVEKARYEIREQERGRAFRSSSPARDMQIGFTRAGVSLTSRDRWRWGLSLRDYGYGERLRPAAPAKLVAAGKSDRVPARAADGVVCQRAARRGAGVHGDGTAGSASGRGTAGAAHGREW
jgi:hypothetical protein